MSKEQERMIRDMKSVFGTEKGEYVLSEIRKYCGQDRSSMNEQSPDVNKTMFNEGKRSVFLRIQWFLEQEVNDG